MTTTQMTIEQHRAETLRLEREIKRLRAKSKLMPTLAAKLDAHRQRQKLEKRLHDHKLNFYVLVRT